MLKENHIYTHWKTVAGLPGWRWPDFSPQELASKGEGELKINFGALDKLQALRNVVGPMVLTSAYRSAAHNRKVGGVENSNHLRGTAFDVVMANHDPVAFEAAARAVGFKGFGYYPAQGFMHIDTGPARTWGDKFPVVGTTEGNMAKAPPMSRHTEKAAAIGAAGTAATGLVASISGLSDTAQLALIGVGVVVGLALVILLRRHFKAFIDAG